MEVFRYKRKAFYSNYITHSASNVTYGCCYNCSFTGYCISQSNLELIIASLPGFHHLVCNYQNAMGNILQISEGAVIAWCACKCHDALKTWYKAITYSKLLWNSLSRGDSGTMVSGFPWSKVQSCWFFLIINCVCCHTKTIADSGTLREVILISWHHAWSGQPVRI